MYIQRYQNFITIKGKTGYVQMLKDTYFEIRNVEANFARSRLDFSVEELLGEVQANKVKTLESSFEKAYVE